MPVKSSIVIADTSCFILLDKINEINILQKVFKRITTTHQIAVEFNKTLPSWVTIKSPSDNRYIQILTIEVDLGEASAIALAMEDNDSLLILDDSKARKLARKLDLNFTGTLGILLKAKELGVVASIKPLINKIQQTNFRFSESVRNEILKEAGEE